MPPRLNRKSDVACQAGPRPRATLAAGILLLALSIPAHSQSTFIQGPGSPYATGGAGPSSVVVAFLHNGANKDYAVTNATAGTVTVMLNDGSGNFSMASGGPVTVGTKPVAIAFASFDDANPFLVVANEGSNNVSVLKGDPTTGVYTEILGSPFPAGTQPNGIVIGYFNSDLVPDVAVSNANGFVTVLAGSSNGTLAYINGTAANSSFAAGSGPSAIAIGYLGNSGNDLAIADATGNSVTVLWANGDGTFTSQGAFPVGSKPVSLVIVSISGGGTFIATANNGDNTVTVLTQNGPLLFQPATGSPYPAGTGPISIASGSFTLSNPLPDLAIADSSGGVTVLLSAGNGSYVTLPGGPFPSGTTPSSIAAGTFYTAESGADLVIANSGSANATVLENASLGTWGPIIAPPILSSEWFGDGPDNGNAVTCGETSSGPGITLWVFGDFNTDDSIYYSATWIDPVNGNQDITGDLGFFSSSQAFINIPSSFYSNCTQFPTADTITIKLADSSSGLSSSAPFTVNPNVVSGATGNMGTPLSATVGTAFSQVLFYGGTPPYSVTTNGTNFPPGLSIPATSSNGTLTGTPTTEGDYAFNVGMVDAWGVGIPPGENWALQEISAPLVSSPVSITVPAGTDFSAGSLPVTLTGSNFLMPQSLMEGIDTYDFNGSMVYWAPAVGQPVALGTTVNAAGTSISTSVPGADMVTPAVDSLLVQQPDGTMTSIPFIVAAPAISILSPSSVMAGAAGFTLTVSGSNYLPPNSVIMFGGTALTTLPGGTSTSVSATVSTALVASAGPVSVTVVNPGGSTSVASTFTITAAAISNLVPSSVVAGSAGFTLAVNGSGFTSASQVMFGGTALTTTFLNASSVTAAVPASAVAFPGAVSVTVVTGSTIPPPLSFTVTPNPNPTPTIAPPLQSSLLTASSPTLGNAITSGTKLTGFLLYINGYFNAGFNHTVVWQNTSTNISTTFTTTSGIVSVGPTQIVVSVPLALFGAPVSGPVTVNVTVTEQEPVSSPPAASVSNAAPFVINPPLAATPKTFPAGSVGTAYSQPLPYTGGTSPFTSSLSSGTLPPGLSLSSAAGPLAGTPTTSGDYAFSIGIADAWGSTVTSADTLQVAALPTITPPIIPASAVAGTGPLQITVNGTNFLVPSLPAAGSVAEWVVSGSSPVALTTVVASTTQLTATIPASLLQTPVAASIVVVQPNGLTSSAVSFPVLAPAITTLSPFSITAGSAAFTLTVTGTSFLSGAQIVFGGTPLTTTFVSGTSLTAQVLAPQIAIPGAVSLTVVNPGSISSAPAIFTVNPNPLPTPVITPPLQASVLGATAATVANGITAGANVSGFLLYINGNFNAGDNHTVNWQNTSTNVSTTFTTQTGILSVSPTLIVVAIPSSLFNPTVTTQVTPATRARGRTSQTAVPTTTATSTVTVEVTVTEQEPIPSPPPAVTSNAAPFLINPPPAPTLPVLPDGSPGTPYDHKVMFSGGTGPYEFELLLGPLPPGLMLDPTTGIISGSPMTPGDYTFTIQVTDTWGDTTDVVEDLQIAALPSITGALVPSSVPAGTPGVIVTITGNNFLVPAVVSGTPVPGSVAQWTAPGGTPVTLTTAVTSTTQATATIPAGLLVAPMAASISIVQPNGNTSNAAPFTVLAPAISSLLPASVTSGIGAFTLSVNGSNFLSGSVVMFGGTTLTTTFVSSTTLQAAVSAALVSKGGAFAVTVVNPGGAASAPVTFTVNNRITILNLTLPPAQIGVLYDLFLTASGGTPPYTWSATGLPSTVSLNSSTGEIRGQWGTAGTYAVTITVTDSTGQTSSGQYSVTVGTAPVPLQITTASPLPTATVGTAYSASFLATGGTPPYTFSFVGTVLPGLGFAGGVLSGSPTTAGAYTFTVSVADSAKGFATASFALTVSPAPLTLTGSVANANLGSAVSVKFGATGGVPPYTFSYTGVLPTGTTFSGGTLAGTLTAAGTFGFSVTVTDSAGSTASKSFSVVVTALPLTITTTSLPNGTVQGVYTASLAASGGVAPYTWSATGVPPGLSFSSGGSITGSPTTAGSYSVGVTVTDTAGSKASQTFPVTIAPIALTITTASLPNGTVGAAYTATLAAAGGVPPYTWSATGLPPGVSVSTAGALSGTPTTAGAYTISATGTDSASSKTSQSFAVTIAPGRLTITTTSLPNGALGAAYSATLAATGGAPPYTWSATGLPTGLAISTAGAMSGTPTAAGSFTVAVTVTDSTRETTASQSYPVTITSAPPAITSLAPPYALAGGAGFTLTVNGTNFVTGSQIVFGGAGLTTAFVNAGSLTAPVAAALVAKAGPIAVTVVNPGGVSSAPANFTAVSKLTILTTSLPAGQTGAAYSFGLLATGGLPPYTWSVTGLPSSLNLNPSTGVITGSWSAAGNYTVTITVNDTSGQRASSQYSTTVGTAPIPLQVVTASVPQATVGVPYGTTFFANGGTAPYNFSFTGSAPPGLTFTGGPSNGAISGTPTAAGQYAFGVTVTDSNNGTASKSFILVVAPAPLTLTGSVSDSTVGATLSDQFGAAGGVPPYFSPPADRRPPAPPSAAAPPWHPCPVRLPPPGTFTFTVTVTDSAQTTISRSFTIHVTVAP